MGYLTEEPMAFAFFKDRVQGHQVVVLPGAGEGRRVFELDLCDEWTGPRTLRVRGRQRSEGGWSLLGEATAPDGRRYQVWERFERPEGPNGRPAA